MRYLINLSYDGSSFYGYQIQNNKLTVEGELERVLSKILNEKVNTVGSSRTDKGVHALNQYCHFDTEKNINPKNLAHSLNSLVNESIYIKKIKKVNNELHARYSVVKKEYIYKINMGEYNPLEKNYVFQYNKKINKELLDEFVKKLSGKHNFKSFTSDKDKENYERELTLDYKISNKILYLRFESTGFLRYMIRNIVGLLLDINDSKKSIEDIENIFKSESRTSCGRCAEPQGLYLNKVELQK
ncbi:MAG: tRNA pseudouridine(38-40) synthase TruA [Bacilli bacterium]|nr:tRNA pseudouridine(38-40) synthase TruA [Bacilli bacterium]